MRKDSSQTPNKSKFMQELMLRLRVEKLLHAYLGFTVIWAINVSTIFRSSWAGDDWPISQTPYWIQWRYGALTNWNIWTEALFWNDQWMRGAGRFYPLTWIESRFVFSYLRELWQYKLYQVVMLFVAGILLTVICFLFTRSHTFTIFALASLSLTIQFRRDFDPHLAFAVMLPSLLIKIFLAVILAYFAGGAFKKSVGLSLGMLAGLLYFAAMSTYEFGFLLFPMLVIAHLLGKAKKITKFQSRSFYLSWLVSLSFFPIVISWLGYGLFVFGYLRPRASAISGSYVLGISWSSIEVFLSQAIMGLPLISMRSVDLRFSLFSILVGSLLILICGKSFKSILKSKKGNFLQLRKEKNENQPNEQHTSLLLLFSMSMILSPGFMMAMQPAWWNRADLMHTYLGVMITEFGTAIFIAIILERIVGRYIKPVIVSTKKS
jgi:hypothetical protein